MKNTIVKIKYTQLSNCDDVIKFLQNLSSHEEETGEIYFQGDKIQYGYFHLKYISIVYRDHFAFTIGKSFNGHFLVCCIDGFKSIVDKVPGIWLPNYVAKEFIETVNGNW